jgi:hypothetical protein
VKEIHSDLVSTQHLIYQPTQLNYSTPVIETESSEYGAYHFKLNNFFITFRVAKITPTKIGQFVTLWKRMGCGPIQPYDISDSLDFVVVCTRHDNYFGQFVFPKSVLCEQGVLSINNGGKRAIRVYPPWNKTMSRQAQKTQAWQLKYFLEIPFNGVVDVARVKNLYAIRAVDSRD